MAIKDRREEKRICEDIIRVLDKPHRLIDAETFPNELKEMMIQIDKNRGEPEEDWFLYGFDEFVIASDVIDLVKEMPTVDAVSVVRCKDCKWWKTNYSWNGWEHKVCVREAYEPLRKAEDYCSGGRRREDADE